MAPSAGYKEFFPNAPRAARDKANERERERSSRVSEAAENDPKIAATAHRDGAKYDSSLSDAAHPPTDDTESLQGDILNGVGSASSHASTASSVFTTTNSSAAIHASSRASNSTPLTTLGSPANSSHIQSAKQQPSAPPNTTGKSDSTKSITVTGPLSKLPSVAKRLPARDPNLTIKGTKCIYDPSTDKNLSSNDRKTMKPRYKNIGLVCTQYTNTRTAISYTYMDREGGVI
ncbi:hypothetical protein M426DRAFT_125190 [Hypoxylon sp. CI-4A]|nr:hypothetical protein M426DRAFT_125190 [Hypoxylon sp. CI-4A]